MGKETCTFYPPKEKIKFMKKLLITSYVNPDLDGVGGMIAYQEFLEKTKGIKSFVGFLGEVQDEVKYIFDHFNFEYPSRIKNSNDFDEVILVDASELSVLEGNIEPEKVIEIIDHRKVHEADKFPNAKVQIELVGAAATLVAEKFVENNIEISKKSAILLLGAVVTGTLNFKGSVTTEKDKKMAEYLNKTAKLSDDFWKEFFIAKSDLSGEKLAKQLESDFAFYDMGNKKVVIAQLETMNSRLFINERRNEIFIGLEKLKKELNPDFIFLNIMDIEAISNFFITEDQKTQKLLERILKINFKDNVAEKKSLMLRKEISPLLKKELEK